MKRIVGSKAMVPAMTGSKPDERGGRSLARWPKNESDESHMDGQKTVCAAKAAVSLLVEGATCHGLLATFVATFAIADLNSRLITGEPQEHRVDFATG